MEFFDIVGVTDEMFYRVGKDYSRANLWAYFLIGAILFLIIYVLQAFALYTIGKREKCGNEWMAFVPFLNIYYIGVVSQKNKIGKTNPKAFSLALAVLDAVLIALNVIYYVAMYKIFTNESIGFRTDTETIYGSIQIVYQVPDFSKLPASLNWAVWVYENLSRYITVWFKLAFTAVEVFLLISFFRTYAAKRYVLFSILSIIFPIKGIFMFAVRNNAGHNYMDYLRGERQRQYQMYQQYMQNNQPPMGGNTPPYQGPEGGAPNNPTGNTPDPFDGLGSDSNNSNSTPNDPFSDL